MKPQRKSMVTKKFLVVLSVLLLLATALAQQSPITPIPKKKGAFNDAVAFLSKNWLPILLVIILVTLIVFIIMLVKKIKIKKTK